MLTLLFACAAPPDSVDAPKPGDTGDTAADTDTDTDTDSDSDTDSDTDTDTDSDTDSESDTDTDSDSDTDTDPASALRISSDTPSSDFGRIVRVGDVTGDGVDDLVSGTFLRDGKTGGGIVVPGPITADGVAEELGFVLTGAERGAGTGRSVSVGDLDGDGVADVGLGAPYSDLDDGMYVTFGPVTGDRALADGALLRAPRSTYGGHGSDLSGDVNGDGQVDAVVGAYWTTSTNGSVFVAFGPVTGDLDLETEADAVLTGEAPDTYAGRTVAAGEDLDGDGIGDLVIACLGTMGPPASGGLYVAYGPPAGAMDLADADGRYVGATANASAGLWLAAGDVSGDGLADLVASAYNDELAKTGGAAYVVYGPASANADLGIADVIVRGDIAGQYGGGVETADFDGDGVHELLLGAQGDPSAGTNGGAAFVFWDPAPGEYNFTDADFAFYAEAAGDNLGVGINAGDVDGDGAMDLLFGAPYEDSGGTDAGSVYVVDP